MFGERAHNIALRQDAEDAMIGTKNDDRTNPSFSQEFCCCGKIGGRSIVTTLPRLPTKMFLTSMAAFLVPAAGVGRNYFNYDPPQSWFLAHAASGITARSSSTTSLAMTTVVNGPIRDEIEMSSGIGALGPYKSNAPIGRAYQLLSINGRGGSVPGDTYMGTLGNTYNYSATFAEARSAAQRPSDREGVLHLRRIV